MWDAQDFSKFLRTANRLWHASHMCKRIDLFHVNFIARISQYELHSMNFILFIWPRSSSAFLCAFLWQVSGELSASTIGRAAAETPVRMQRRRIERKWHRFVFTFAIRSTAQQYNDSVSWCPHNGRHAHRQAMRQNDMNFMKVRILREWIATSFFFVSPLSLVVC